MQAKKCIKGIQIRHILCTGITHTNTCTCAWMRNDNTIIHCAYERSPERARIITYLTYDAYHLITFLTWYDVLLLGRCVFNYTKAHRIQSAESECVCGWRHTHITTRNIHNCMHEQRPAGLLLVVMMVVAQAPRHRKRQCGSCI